jgi:AraC-like DNA-binding protein
MERLKKLLDKMEIDILNVEYCRVGTEWNYRNVNNPYSRIYLVTHGTATMTHHGQTFDLRPGNLYLIPCFTQVDMFCPDYLRHYYVHFTARIETGLDILSLFACHYQADAERSNITRKFFDRLLELNPHRELSDYDARKPIFATMLDHAHRLDQAKTPANLLETNALLRLLLAVFFSDFAHPQTDNTLQGLARFSPVLDYLREHLHQPITVAQLAECVDLNPTYFCNLFSRYMGVSPIQYINKRRIEEAQKLLLSGHDTLFQIAQKVGFSDEYYFSRVFKKIVGLAPAHYRKQEILRSRR